MMFDGNVSCSDAIFEYTVYHQFKKKILTNKTSKLYRIEQSDIYRLGYFRWIMLGYSIMVYGYSVLKMVILSIISFSKIM